VVKEGVARFRSVELGLRSDTHVEVHGDLEAGTPVVTGPYKILRELEGGTAVEVQPAASGESRASP
jgi:hypothetical protein